LGKPRQTGEGSSDDLLPGYLEDHRVRGVRAADLDVVLPVEDSPGLQCPDVGVDGVGRGGADPPPVVGVPEDVADDVAYGAYSRFEDPLNLAGDFVIRQFCSPQRDRLISML
jgi:hypothetical protein